MEDKQLYVAALGAKAYDGKVATALISIQAQDWKEACQRADTVCHMTFPREEHWGSHVFSLSLIDKVPKL